MGVKQDMNKPVIVAEIAQGYEGNTKLVELYSQSASYAGQVRS